MDCKALLLKRINDQFQCETDGFFFEGKKYEFSQLSELREEIRKVSGYCFNLGFVDSHHSESDKESQEDQEYSDGEEASKKDSDQSSDEESERSSDREEQEESYSCIGCEKSYSNPFRLIRHMESRHMQLSKDSLEIKSGNITGGHCCLDCGCQFSTQSNLSRHRKCQHD
jgi:hypothetical protein